jgi:hypothetical protein
MRVCSSEQWNEDREGQGEVKGGVMSRQRQRGEGEHLR